EEALELLGELENGEGISMLIKIARTHPDLELREEAMEALADMDDARAKKALRQMAK
ncbi:MAG: hypothetical protein GY906_12710, partial [bacterium]|nr:hypothetical protein [bacterium]